MSCTGVLSRSYLNIVEYKAAYILKVDELME